MLIEMNGAKNRWASSGLTNGAGKGMTNGLGGAGRGYTNGSGLTNGAGRGMTNGMGRGLTNGAGRGMTNGMGGRTNGLSSGGGKGMTNGLTNGLMGTRRMTDPNAAMAPKRLSVVVVVILVLMLPLSLMLLAQPQAVPGRLVNIDGNFKDWGKMPTYVDFSTCGDAVLDVSEFSIALDGTDFYLRLKAQGNLLSRAYVDRYFAFIDADANPGTGYDALGVGAEYVVEAYGSASADWSVSSSKFMGADRHNWSAFTGIGSGYAESDGQQMEAKGGLDVELNAGSVRVRVASMTSSSMADVCAPIIDGKNAALVVMQTPLDNAGIISATGLLTLQLFATGGEASYSGITVAATGVSPSTIPGGVLADGGSSTVQVSASAEPPVRTPVKASVASVAMASGTYSVQGDGLSAYYASAPSTVAIDGAFADWTGIATSSDEVGNIANPNIDIIEDAAVQQSGAFYTYVKFNGAGKAMVGMAVPQARTASSGGSGGGDSGDGGTTILPRVSGEDVCRFYIDSKEGGAVKNGITADFVIELRGRNGIINEKRVLTYPDMVQIGTASAENGAREIEASATLLQLGHVAGNISMCVETTDWERKSDSAAKVTATRSAGTRGVLDGDWGTATTNTAVCTATGDQGSVALLPDGQGGAIIAWSDSRSGNDDVYAQRVSLTQSTVVINEVMFDPTSGNDWVELANPTLVGYDISGWKLIDDSDAVIHTFPVSTNLAAGAYAVPAALDSPTALGSSDALSLVDADGAIRDYVAWGAVPTGNNYTKAVASENWYANTYVSTSGFVQGNSIGRNRYSNDTNQAGDWEITCGVDAGSPTPIQPNVPEFPSIMAAPLLFMLVPIALSRRGRRFRERQAEEKRDETIESDEQAEETDTSESAVETTEAAEPNETTEAAAEPATSEPAAETAKAAEQNESTEVAKETPELTVDEPASAEEATESEGESPTGDEISDVAAQVEPSSGEGATDESDGVKDEDPPSEELAADGVEAAPAKQGFFRRYWMLIAGFLLATVGIAGTIALRLNYAQVYLLGDSNPYTGIGTAEPLGHGVSTISFVIGIIMVVYWGIKTPEELDLVKALDEGCDAMLDEADHTEEEFGHEYLPPHHLSTVEKIEHLANVYAEGKMSKGLYDENLARFEAELEREKLERARAERKAKKSLKEPGKKSAYEELKSLKPEYAENEEDHLPPHHLSPEEKIDHLTKSYSSGKVSQAFFEKNLKRFEAELKREKEYLPAEELHPTEKLEHLEDAYKMGVISKSTYEKNKAAFEEELKTSKDAPPIEMDFKSEVAEGAFDDLESLLKEAEVGQKPVKKKTLLEELEELEDL